MTEPIGMIKNGTLCLYPFEKHYITLCPQDRLLLEKASLNKLKFGPIPDIDTRPSEQLIHDLEAVLERVMATPGLHP